MQAEFLRMRGISKRYGGTQALRAVDFSAATGEVHAIVGENGAGKSTLTRILTGAVASDAGEILIDGEPQAINSPLRGHELGIRMVHQHVALVPNLSVTENILLGSMPAGRLGWWIDWPVAHRKAQEILAAIGFEGIDVRMRVSRLSASQHQVVEIAKAVAVKPRILIMDEPSAVLAEDDLRTVFALIGRLRENGVLILYISHRLDELYAIADRVTVLKDGALVGTVDPKCTDKDALIRLMVGRTLEEIFPRRQSKIGTELLRLTGLGRAGSFDDVSFSVAQGEIVGLYGLIGSGRTEVARCVFGADQPSRGEIRRDGRRLRIRSPRDALRAGIAMLTEDRIGNGLVLGLPIRDNVSLASFDVMSRWGVLNRRRQSALVQSKTRELDVRPADIDRLVRTLSGGNQQKVVLAKWLLTRARVLLLDEPTRGVDVAAKKEIYATIAELAAHGMGILLISSELPELLGMSDRILVMREGRLAGEFPRTQATEEKILSHAN
ncbi:MAG TPA: sugar ABC transporter ATP-binding protein [Casimicrobiaceae bacterium]|nr:sugar ABC transporter ATP-binding protein [Casimicrobiaceae bacterium]